MDRIKTLDEYFKHKKRLILLEGKKPITRNWVTVKTDKSLVYSHAGNIGWALSKTDLVIDVDPRNGGNESFIKLVKHIKKYEDVKISPKVSTPSGGFHVYLKKDEDSEVKKNLKDYKGIDFLSFGHQCVIPSSSTLNGVYRWYDGLSGFEQLEAPDVLIDLLSKETEQDSGLGDFEGLIDNNPLNIDEEGVVKILCNLDPSMDYHDWLRVGMALHDWDKKKGLTLWENWSKTGGNYQEDITETKWNSFKNNGGITLGTIMYMSKETEFDRKEAEISDMIDKINHASKKQIQSEIAPSVSNKVLNAIDKQRIVVAIQTRIKNIDNITVPIVAVRAMLTKKEKAVQAPPWCKDWVYVNSHSGFISTKTLTLHKSESFNIQNGKYIAESEGGGKPSAVKYVSDNGFIDIVDSTSYLPYDDNVLCNVDGHKVLNMFNKKSVPTASDLVSKKGKEAIKMIRNHIKHICTTENNTEVLTQWIAHQVQFPGKKILWSPLIQSIQGVGKSFFGELLRSCLGDRNVGTVAPNQVNSDFNGWAENVMVNVLEEIRIKGHNRHDIVNALKPLITDRIIQINDKNVKHHTTVNVTNYICFTNYKDAIPVDIHDRRWWIIFVPFQSLDEMGEALKVNVAEYFPKLFDAIRDNKADLRRYLLDYPITDEFKNTMQAPMTQHKEQMVSTEEACVEGLSELKDLIKQGGRYFNEECISSSDLFATLDTEYVNISIPNNKKHYLLKSLGYSVHPKPVKIDGKTRKIWTKRPLSNEEIRRLLI